eukprot:TRINITY_DN3748_c0_g2_i1.p2 TRINITY_DN3748_c0_g2~~TRINITY_DN3748_c0_g2_i1.p2  ORF type:complete len:166 (+),score=29.79 TRINITY_DN3748_c0_g2_i1:163-660(+)
MLVRSSQRSNHSLRTAYSPKTYQLHPSKRVVQSTNRQSNLPASPAGELKPKPYSRAKATCYSHNTSPNRNLKASNSSTQLAGKSGSSKERPRVSFKSNLSIKSAAKTQRMSAKGLASKEGSKNSSMSLNKFLLATKQLKPQKGSKAVPRVQIKKPIEDSKDITIV